MKKRLQVQKKNEAQPVPSQIDLPEPKEDISFPIVGIGSSAGGLEALEQFLGGVPQGSGMAFIIVQHLDPTRKGLMPELLQRVTAMKVFQVRDSMEVKPDCIYVIPPNKDMSILNGKLHLFKPTASRGLRLPINFFLSSMADDLRERSIGVILSGMGSDGTIGLAAIKEKGGLGLVQDPESSRFDSMPRSAINAGVAAIVASAEDLPGKIIESFSTSLKNRRDDFLLTEKDQSTLEKIIVLLRAKTGHDFSMYKKNTLYRRIERRMSIHQVNKIAFYVRYLQENPQEVELLFKELLIGVTSFFRDPGAWKQLQEESIPTILAGFPEGGTIRAWSAGCSTGEEAYSLAIVIREAIEKKRPYANLSFQIFATDLDRDAIDKARQGIYPGSIVTDISQKRLERFFIREGSNYRVCNEIREKITFATQNVIMDPPFTRLDIIICRNLLIYMMPLLQKKLMPLFHYSLNPGGILFLGSSEAITTFTDLFEPVDIKSRLFLRCNSFMAYKPVVFPVSFTPAIPGEPKDLTMVKPVANLQALADQLLLHHYSPPAVLVTSNGDILYINGRTGKYLEPAAGKANWNIFAMAREGLSLDLGIAFQKALRQKEVVTVKGLKVSTNGGGIQSVDITVQAIEEEKELKGMVMIVFKDVETPSKKRSSRSNSILSDNARVFELEKQLQQCREELQTMREEMQSSQEELKSTNEELQSTNEELQSTNEELTTSREEMQSMNEELQTVNAEQLSKMDELSKVNDDMRNLLNSTEVVTIFLDNKLKVRRFTTGADKLFKLIPGDVGRPLSDISNDLLYAEMIGEAREVLRTLIFSEKQISTTDGRWFSVRIMPYRTMDNLIAGVVITFADITATKILEAELREENARLKSLLETHDQSSLIKPE